MKMVVTLFVCQQDNVPKVERTGSSLISGNKPEKERLKMA